LKDFLDSEERQGDDQALKSTHGEQLVTDFQAAFGEQLESNPRDDILELARRVIGKTVKPRIYRACGTDNDRRGDSLKSRDEIAKLNFDVVYEEWPGAHDWTFFNESYRRALKRCFGG
jgi:S-formylglutathione hydrolase FrmB